MDLESAATINQAIDRVRDEIVKPLTAVIANSVTQIVAEAEAIGRRMDRLIALLERLDGATLALDLGRKK